MSTTHYHIVVKSDSSEACEFTGENTSLRIFFFPFFGLSGSLGCRSRVSVSGVAGLELGKLPTKSAGNCSEHSVSMSNMVNNLRVLSIFLEDEVNEKYPGPRRELDLHCGILKSCHLRISPGIVWSSPHSWRLLNAM